MFVGADKNTRGRKPAMATTLITMDIVTAADQSLSLGPWGPWAFDQQILNTPFPPWYRPPINIPRYSKKTNPDLWLEDYWLVCQANGTDNAYFIIRQPPFVLG